MAKSPDNNSYDSDDHRKGDGQRSEKNRIDAQVARLLKAADQTQHTVDHAFLKRLEETTTKEFLDFHTVDQTYAELSSDDLTDDSANVESAKRSIHQSKPRKNPMVVFAFRALAAMFAGAIIWFGFSLVGGYDDS